MHKELFDCQTKSAIIKWNKSYSQIKQAILIYCTLIDRYEDKSKYQLLSRGTTNLLLPGYPVNKCFIPNSISDNNAMDRQRVCSPCLLCRLRVSRFLLSIRKITRICNVHYRVCANESKGLKFREKYIASLVNSTWDVNSLLKYFITYSNMNSFIGYINNTMIILTIYFNSHMRIDEQINNIIPCWIHVFIQDRGAYKHKNALLFFFFYLQLFSRINT